MTKPERSKKVRIFDITWNDYIVTANCIGDDKKKFIITVDCRSKTIVENGKSREIDYWEYVAYV